MSVNTEINSETHRAVTAFAGYVSGLEALEAFKDVFEHEAFPSLEHWIVDCEQTVDLDVSGQQVRVMVWIAAKHSPANPDLHIALIGTEDGVFAILRMFEIQTKIFEGKGFQKTEVFRSIDEAHQWLKEHLGSTKAFG